MKTMYKGVVNSPETFLKENLVQGATTMYVADGSVFGTLPTLAVIGDDESAETVLVESVDGGAYTIKRAFEGTAKDWTKGTTVARNFTNYDYQALVDNIAELGGRKIPTKLSELTDDNTHRLVTDTEKKAWGNKVDKVTGKGLSTNDYTDTDKQAVGSVDAKITAVNQTLSTKASKSEIKTKLSEMTDDSAHRLVTDSEKSNWNNKLSSVFGQDISRSKTKGYNTSNTWQSISTNRDLEDWIGDFDKRTRENQSNISSKVNKSDLSNYANKNDLSNCVQKSDLSDFKRCKVLTQAEYNALSNDEKNRDDTLYFIKA